MNIAVIDGGTTNTRIRVVDSHSLEILSRIKLNQGVRDQAISKDFGMLESLIINELEKLKESFNINSVIVYGMLTSNIGIYEIPHINAPINTDILASQITYKFWNGMDSYWITGMVNNEAPIDIMRGEEVEALGMLRGVPVTTDGVILLPGSHTKFITVSQGTTLTSCISTLAGELFHATQQGTILSDSVVLTKKIESSFLLEGYKLAQLEGITRAMYHVRLRHLFTNYTENQRANLLLGAILHDDLKVLNQITSRIKVNWIYLGGYGTLQEAYLTLLKQTQQVPIHIFKELEMEKAALLGAVAIANV